MCVLEIQDVHPMRKHLDFIYGAARWPPNKFFHNFSAITEITEDTSLIISTYKK